MATAKSVFIDELYQIACGIIRHKIMKKAACFLLTLLVLCAFSAVPVEAAGVFTGYALKSGVTSETVAMLILLPLVATVVSFLHYYIGLTGYGIFMPTMMAITFLSMGIIEGLILFAVILVISLFSNIILKKLKLHFWPARAINLVLISVGVLLANRTYMTYGTNRIDIYAIMIMILLVEEFVRTQLIKSKIEARNLTVGTLLLAVMGAGIMSIGGLKNWVLNNSDITILFILVANIVIGNYKGMRLTEIARFKKAIRK